ncbi:MAG TPA: 1-(5-phosphoribosyl)-5-[(5-phosphoribosylamino)methylideneamino]imidazole-4-carboxamide isomerase [Flavobacteriales bacterium]
MEIIPAIDLINGQCVRLSQGDFDSKKVYSSNPLEVAKQFEEAGIKRLHIVDLDGAKSGKICNLPVLETIASNTSLMIDMGGGIRSNDDVAALLNAGAAFVSVGSIAYKQPIMFKEWLNTFGADKFLLGADVKDEKIAVHGWLENTDYSVYDFINEHLSNGIKQVFCTDIATDGMLKGPSIYLYKKLLERFPSIHLIASGGVSSIEDVKQLDAIGCHGVIIGKAIYEGKIAMHELTELITTSSC